MIYRSENKIFLCPCYEHALLATSFCLYSRPLVYKVYGILFDELNPSASIGHKPCIKYLPKPHNHLVS